MNNEKLITSIVEIKVLKKVLLSLRSLDENKLIASVIKAIFIDMGKLLIIVITMLKIVRKMPIRDTR
ncbi:MAG: hypothetical protein KGD70_07075 [Candidatus Lokiarchaeota archaeon]|nr:hypothetical protein [Candidatus Lokiarchaeota archaeon]